jgi:hypothetical protein
MDEANRELQPSTPPGEEAARKGEAGGDRGDIPWGETGRAQRTDQASHAAAGDEIGSDALPFEDVQDTDVSESPGGTASERERDAR